jgi:hypothetical protein
MTGGRAYLYDPSGRHVAALDERSVRATRLAAVVAERADGSGRLDELVALLADHRVAGSALAERLLETVDLAAVTWLVEPVDPAVGAAVTTGPVVTAEAASQPDRNPAVPGPLPTPVARGGTVESTWGSVTPG